MHHEKILVKQLKEWRENEVMMQKKKTQKKKEDDKSGEGDASMNDMVTLEGKFEVGSSKMPSDSGAFAEFLGSLHYHVLGSPLVSLSPQAS